MWARAHGIDRHNDYSSVECTTITFGQAGQTFPASNPCARKERCFISCLKYVPVIDKSNYAYNLQDSAKQSPVFLKQINETQEYTSLLYVKVIMIIIKINTILPNL